MVKEKPREMAPQRQRCCQQPTMQAVVVYAMETALAPVSSSFANYYSQSVVATHTHLDLRVEVGQTREVFLRACDACTFAHFEKTSRQTG